MRDKDVSITDITPHMMSQITKGTVPGRAPLLLIGPEVNKHKKFLVCITRDGKGIVVANNDSPFKVIANKEVSKQIHSFLRVFLLCETQKKKWFKARKQELLNDVFDIDVINRFIWIP